MKNEIGLFAREIRIHDGYVNPDTPEEPPAMCIAFILSAKNRAITFRFDLMKFVKQREDTLRQMEKTGIYIVDVCSHSLNEEEGDTPAPEGECPYINGKCYSLHQSGSGLQALGILQVLGEEGLWKHLEEKFYSFLIFLLLMIELLPQISIGTVNVGMIIFIQREMTGVKCVELLKWIVHLPEFVKLRFI